jgi:hypothetical protein
VFPRALKGVDVNLRQSKTRSCRGLAVNLLWGSNPGTIKRMYLRHEVTQKHHRDPA